MDVDPVDQRAADFRHIALDLRRRAMATAPRIASIAAGARIERGDQHEVGRERGAVERSRDRHGAIFQRLTQHFERLAVELGQFIEKKHTVVRQRNFAGRGRGTAADQARIADGMMRRSERPDGQQRLARP